MRKGHKRHQAQHVEGWVRKSDSSELDEFESGVARGDNDRPIPQLKFPLYYLEVTESKITTVNR